MAIDTKAKRLTAMEHEEIATEMGSIVPDGTIDQSDRQSVLLTYSGILVSTVTDVIRDIIGTGIIPFKR